MASPSITNSPAAACPAAEARSLVEKLRKHAQTLPFEDVSEIIELEGEDCRLILKIAASLIVG